MKLYYRENGIPPGVPTQKGSNADPYVTGIALPNVPLGNYDVPSGWPTSVKFNPPGDVPGPTVQFESEDMGEAKAGLALRATTPTRPTGSSFIPTTSAQPLI